MRIDEALRWATQKLSHFKDGEGRRDATVLLSNLLGDREILYRAPELELKPSQEASFRAQVIRRAKFEPVSHIIGKREFFGRDFAVNENVLDPRADSETLIEAVLGFSDQLPKNPRILDLGTGTGCLLLTLLAELPEATGVGADLSPKALKVARQNAFTLELTNRVSFVESSWFENVQGTFDLILSNPPYIETADIERLQEDVRMFEPHLALDGGADGLDCYREIVGQASNFLKAGGFLIFEFGQGQEVSIQKLMQAVGFENFHQYQDLGSIVRCLSGRLKN